ncbi:hypothetical protein TorRG33x02_074010 [Trema orientale]|uniref:Uncharacterized protein n=1 Tax=Trema orientale TaxID=63057 RepID=A0A2P5FFY5_TREOI|nr:hypothetical protein TorRG33x02_074010 [Trema orientale]
MLMNLMPLSFPIGATWRLLGWWASKPTKQPTVVFWALSEEHEEEEEEKKGEGVAMMLGGTWVRIGCPLARNWVPSRVIDVAELPSMTPITSRAALLLRLGAMGMLVFSRA